MRNAVLGTEVLVGDLEVPSPDGTHKRDVNFDAAAFQIIQATALLNSYF